MARPRETREQAPIAERAAGMSDSALARELVESGATAAFLGSLRGETPEPQSKADTDEDREDEQDAQAESETEDEDETESPDAEDGETAEDGDESGEDDAEETESDGDTDSITLDGKEYTTDELREFRDAGLRQADYTRKTQEVAEQRKEVSTMHSDLITRDEELRGEEEDFMAFRGEQSRAAQMHVQALANTDWKALAASDPVQFQAKREELTRAQQGLEHFESVNAQMLEALKNKRQERRAKIAEVSKRQLTAHFGSWNDERYSDLYQYATDKAGIDGETFKGLIHSGLIIALDKARQFDAAQETTAKALKPAKRATDDGNVRSIGSKRTRKGLGNPQSRKNQRLAKSIQRARETGDPKAVQEMLMSGGLDRLLGRK